MISIPKHSLIRPQGVILISDPDHPHEIQRDLYQCIHCQAMWVAQPGSGKIRGFCTRCMGPVCGPACAECVHFEKKCEQIEAGQRLSF